jgi:hypothetical protein
MCLQITPIRVGGLSRATAPVSALVDARWTSPETLACGGQRCRPCEQEPSSNRRPSWVRFGRAPHSHSADLQDFLRAPTEVGRPRMPRNCRRLPEVCPEHGRSGADARAEIEGCAPRPAVTPEASSRVAAVRWGRTESSTARASYYARTPASMRSASDASSTRGRRASRVREVRSRRSTLAASAVVLMEHEEFEGRQAPSWTDSRRARPRGLPSSANARVRPTWAPRVSAGPRWWRR